MARRTTNHQAKSCLYLPPQPFILGAAERIRSSWVSVLTNIAWKVNSPRAGYRFTEFFEVHLWSAERWSVIRVMSSSCSQLGPVKEDSSSIRNSTSDLSSPWSARSSRRRGKPNIS